MFGYHTLRQPSILFKPDVLLDIVKDFFKPVNVYVYFIIYIKTLLCRALIELYKYSDNTQNPFTLRTRRLPTVFNTECQHYFELNFWP